MKANLRHEWGCLIPLIKASATVFEAGQVVSVESNAAVHMDLVTEDATFAGVVSIGAGDGETLVQVCPWGVVDIDCTSGTYAFGAGLKYSAGDSSTDYSLVADGSANTIMHSYQIYTTAVTRIQAYFNVFELAKLFAVSA